MAYSRSQEEITEAATRRWFSPGQDFGLNGRRGSILVQVDDVHGFQGSAGLLFGWWLLMNHKIQVSRPEISVPLSPRWILGGSKRARWCSWVLARETAEGFESVPTSWVSRKMLLCWHGASSIVHRRGGEVFKCDVNLLSPQ